MSDTGSGKPPIHMVLPGPIDTLTGGFIYDRHMVDALRRRGRLGAVVCLKGTYPNPSPADLHAAKHCLGTIPRSGFLVIDGLALTALAGHDGALPLGCAPIALIHHPLCDETGLAPDQVEPLFQAEYRALRRAAGCIVTSPTTRRRLADFDQTRDRVATVIPGIARPSTLPRRGETTDGSHRLLCVATLSPRKGQDGLLRALAELTDLDWCLDLIGGARDPEFAHDLHQLARTLGLADRVTFFGEIPSDAVEAHYRSADLFVLASHHEGFGMALAEAMAHGLPIVSTLAGAIPETVPAAAGILVPPNDDLALTAALRQLLVNNAARATAGRAARLAAARFPSWEQAGDSFIAAVDHLSARS